MKAARCRPIIGLSWRTARVNKDFIQTGARRAMSLEVCRSEKSNNQTMVKSPFRTHDLARPLHRQSSTMSRKAPNYDSELDLPPITLLNSARKSGLLPIAPEQILDFLREFQSQMLAGTPGWQRKVCLNHDIDPWTLGLIAGIIEKCEQPGQKRFGGVLLGTAASFGDRAAVFKIVFQANVQRRLNDFPDALKQVGLLAKKGNDPQAMTLLGTAFYSQQREKEALEWYQRATSDALDFHGAATALVNEGRILMADDRDGAIAAFQRAASELDDPSAFFYLAKMQPPGSANHEKYLVQAASSGLLEACHNLGTMEMAKMNDGMTPSSLQDYGLAREWTQVAAEGGFGLSMLNMALMCKSVGQLEEALQWLTKAEGIVNVRGEAQSLRASWEQEDKTQDEEH